MATETQTTVERGAGDPGGIELQLALNDNPAAKA